MLSISTSLRSSRTTPKPFFSADVKYTENNQVLPLGDGIWKTVQERGIVYAYSVFDQGTVNQGVLSTGQPYTFNGFNRPSSILVTEAFLIENGKIRHVEMIGPSAPYHINSPWGGLCGN